MLRGLFIGIDKYPAPITRLTCAKADALALGRLFEDNSDNGSVTKLVDADATRENILRAIEDLKTAREDDFVVITFSGHGTDDHRLVPIDAAANDLGGTCIRLMNWRFTSCDPQPPNVRRPRLLLFRWYRRRARVRSDRCPVSDSRTGRALSASSGATGA